MPSLQYLLCFDACCDGSIGLNEGTVLLLSNSALLGTADKGFRRVWITFLCSWQGKRCARGVVFIRYIKFTLASLGCRVWSMTLDLDRYLLIQFYSPVHLVVACLFRLLSPTRSRGPSLNVNRISCLPLTHDPPLRRNFLVYENLLWRRARSLSSLPSGSLKLLIVFGADVSDTYFRLRLTKARPEPLTAQTTPVSPR